MFAPPIVGSAHSKLPALRHLWLRRPIRGWPIGAQATPVHGSRAPSRTWRWKVESASIHYPASLMSWLRERGLSSAFDEGLEFFEARKADQVVPDHLFHYLVRLLAGLDQDQHADDRAAVRLDLDTIAIVGQEMSAAEESLECSEEHLDQLVRTIHLGNQFRCQIETVGHDPQHTVASSCPDSSRAA